MTIQHSIRAIVGLGNPGPRYDSTRHNAGFWFVDELARRWSVTFRTDSKLGGEVASCGVGLDKVLLLKPSSFMNRSGGPVRALLHYYKFTPDQLLVAYDELDLPPGTARLKSGGGHGGHNGLRDLFVQLPATNFLRLRLGIGHPGHKSRVSSYVLSRPTREDEQAVTAAIDRSLDVIDDLINGRLERAMNELHRST